MNWANPFVLGPIRCCHPSSTKKLPQHSCRYSILRSHFSLVMNKIPGQLLWSCFPSIQYRRTAPSADSKWWWLKRPNPLCPSLEKQEALRACLRLSIFSSHNLMKNVTKVGKPRPSFLHRVVSSALLNPKASCTCCNGMEL